ncbi:MAG TPA: hypothetical protein PL048_23140, partial [Leptospiraceae bacterium]|nr:hypothetical protein [Leptospiraceae bacterium]
NIRLSTVIGIAVLSALNGIHGQSKTAKLSPENFSDYQGAMNWEDARKKCSSIGMKLPICAVPTVHTSAALNKIGTQRVNLSLWTAVLTDRLNRII